MPDGDSFWQNASPIIGGALDAFGAVAGGLFSANQARKNRKFQERMYNKQVEDNRENWRMQNEYNLPSAQMQRLKDAGLNPLLMYGSGGVSNTATSPAAGGSLPSGSAASANFHTNFGQAMYQAAMMREQIGLMRAERDKTEKESEKIASETDWQNIENRFSKETYDIRRAIKYGDWDYLKTSMDQMRTDMYNSSQITTQQVLSMIQGRQYEIKRFNLDEKTIGEQLLQGWKHLSNEKTQANAAWKSASAAMLNALTQQNISKWQIGAIAQDIYYKSRMQPLYEKALSLDNMLKRWDTHLRKATLTEKQVNTFNQKMKNFYYQRYGTEEPFKFGNFYDMNNLRSFSNMFDAMFTIPYGPYGK